MGQLDASEPDSLREPSGESQASGLPAAPAGKADATGGGWGEWATSLFRSSMGLLGWLLLCAYLFSFLGRYSFWAELLGNFQVQFLCLLFAYCWVARFFQFHFQKWLLCAATVCCAACVGFIFLPADQPPAGTQTVQVMSFNLYAAAEDFEQVQKAIDDASPDILVAIEYDGQWHRGLQSLQEIYPHTLLVPRWHGFGAAIFSRFPLEDPQVYQLIPDETDAPLPVANVLLGDQKIHLIAVHVLSPTNPMRMELRNRQFDEMVEIVNQAEHPTLVIGDFNAVPGSPYVQEFLRNTNLRDSRQGFGVQASWHRVYWPLRIPIDNAFVSSRIHVHRRWVGSGTDSDHFPIHLEISVADSHEGP